MRTKVLVSAAVAVGLAVAVWQRTNPPRPRPPAVPPPVAVVRPEPMEQPPAAEVPPPTPPVTPPPVPAPPTVTPGLPPEPSARWVMSLAFSPDGRRLATGVASGRLRLWDTVTRKPVAEAEADGAHWAVAYSPDGKTLVSGGPDGVIRRWEPDTLRPVEPPVGRVGSVLALTFDRDGTLLTGDRDGAVTFWDPGTRRRTRTVRGDGMVHSLGSADGRVVAGCSLGPVRVWVPGGGDEGRRLPLHSDRLAVGPDGRFLVGKATGWEWVDERHQAVRQETVRHTFALWDAGTGRWLADLTSEGGSHVAFSPDGRVVVTQAGVGGEWLFWEVATGRCIHRQPTGEGSTPLFPIAFSPDGRQVASGWHDGQVRFADWPPDPGRWSREAATADPERLWADLTRADPIGGYRAAWTLAADPPRAVALLADRVRPTPVPDQIPRLIADLEDPDYPVREAASQELRRLGPAAGPALRAAAVRSPSAEVRRRAEAVLAAIGPGFPLHGDALRAVRVVMALETANAPAARDLLRRWAADPAADPLLAGEARRALARLEVVNTPE